MRDCSALKLDLDAAIAALNALTEPGIRAVQDSDGSRAEYSTGSLAAAQDRLKRAQIAYDLCQCHGRPLGYLF